MPKPERPPILLTLAVAAGLFVGPPVLAVLTLLVADGARAGLLVLWGEPLWWVLLLTLSGWLVAEQRWVLGGATGAGLVAGALLLRVPVVFFGAAIEPSAEVDRTWLDPAPPVRAAQVDAWRAGGLPLPDVDPDLLLLFDTAPVPGAAWLEHEDGRGLAVLAAEGLDDLGGEPQRALPLPGGRALLVGARAGGGVVPVVVAQLDDGHPAALRLGASALASLVTSLDTNLVVLALSAPVHSTFRRFPAILGSAPVAPASSRATWPARIGSLPVPPLYHTDTLWLGSAWEPARVHRHRYGSSHLALSAELRIAAP